MSFMGGEGFQVWGVFAPKPTAMQAADTPLDLDDRWALGHISPAWPGNGAERTEFRTYSGGGGRAGVRAQGVGTGWGHLAYLTHTVGLWINS